ncbi:MAG: hypothetical protein M3Y50_10780 [Acidobacteriota bacterium]|nr:hypothetical protein [Acidobacteriota bacterium]
MKLLIIVCIIVCLSGFNALEAHPASIKVINVSPDEVSSSLPSSLTLLCTTDLEPSRCMAAVNVLAKVLERYSGSNLGKWKFVVASSDQRKQIVKTLGGDTESPAFTELEARVTVFDEAVFDNKSARRESIAQQYGQPVSGFLDYAVTHEMGHAICQEHDEKLADAYGLDLRMGIIPACTNQR